MGSLRASSDSCTNAATRRLAEPTPARMLTNSQCDTSSCTSDGPSISCRDRAPAAVNAAREPTAASSKPRVVHQRLCSGRCCGGSGRCRSRRADGKGHDERRPETSHQRGEVSEKCGGTEPFPVDSRPGRVTALGFMVLDGRRLENRLQPARAGVASACSGKAKWKSQYNYAIS